MNMKFTKVAGGGVFIRRNLRKGERQVLQRSLFEALWETWYQHVPWDAKWELELDPLRDRVVRRYAVEKAAVEWIDELQAAVREPVTWLLILERCRYGFWRVHVLTAGLPAAGHQWAFKFWNRRHKDAHFFPIDQPTLKSLFRTKAGAAEADVTFFDGGLRFPRADTGRARPGA